MNIPPSSDFLERQVIGAIIFDPETALGMLDGLKVEDFYHEKHGTIYRAILAVQAKGDAVHIGSLVQWLEDSQKMASIGGMDTLAGIMAESVSAWGMETNVKAIKGYSQRRKLIASLTASLEQAKDPQIPIEEATNSAEAAIFRIGEDKAKVRGLVPMRTVMQDAWKEWQEAANGMVKGVLTNIPAIDSIIKGYRPGTLNVIAARPGMGKSMICLQAALQSGVTVAIYSLEMMIREQAERLMAQSVPGISAEGLCSQNVLNAMSEKLLAATKRLSGEKLHFCDNSSITLSQIMTQCRRLKKSDDLKLIVVDYLQLVATEEKFDSRVREVGAVSKFLKRLGNELEIPVIAIAALSRDCEKREDKRPILSDLRESGEIESDAHSVTFLYRHSEYDKALAQNKRLAGVTEIIHRKNRGGPKGTAFCDFDGTQSKFFPMDENHQKEYYGYITGKSDSVAF